jgi:ADP-ribosylglycohydrolase
MSNKELLNKYLGCVFSFAVADAFASPYEGPFTKEFISGLNIDTGFYKKNKIFKPGEYSTKTLSLLSAIDCYLEHKKLDEKQLFKSHEKTFAGPEELKGDIYSTLYALTKKEPAPVGIADNSASMRAPVIGLWNYDKKPKELTSEAVKNSHTTHKDFRSEFGSVLISSAVAFLLTVKKPLRPPALFARIAEHLELADKKFIPHLKILSQLLKKNPEYVFFKLAKEGNDKYSKYEYGGGIPPFVTGSVLLSLYFFLKNPVNFKGLITDCIKSAGALTPVCTMAASLFGAYNGYNPLPANLVDDLIGKEEIYKKTVMLFKLKHAV